MVFDPKLNDKSEFIQSSCPLRARRIKTETQRCLQGGHRCYDYIHETCTYWVIIRQAITAYHEAKCKACDIEDVKEQFALAATALGKSQMGLHRQLTKERQEIEGRKEDHGR